MKADQIKRTAKRGGVKRRKPSARTSAFHGQTDRGEDWVGVENLRVVIVPDGDCWFAQGLEIDYAAQGESVDDVRKRFQDGLCATIHEHLRMYGNIEQFLKPAPREVWRELFYEPTASLNSHTQISCHRLKQKPVEQFPFTGIEYRELEKVAA